MSPATKKVELSEYDISPGDGEGRILKFYLDAKLIIEVNITDSSCQSNLELLFVNILKEALTSKDEIVFSLGTYPEGKENDFYALASKQYVNDLNSELSEVFSSIREEQLAIQEEINPEELT